MESSFARSCSGLALAGVLGLLLLGSADAAVQAAPPEAYAVTPDTTLEELVAPIALYPDDLLAILLPAAAYPLDVVQASRFLDQLEKDKNLQPDEAWDESVRNLLNTPEVVRIMADNLDWTIRLGEEVVADQGAVMEVVQRFRRQVETAGNLESDDKQTIVIEEDVVRIETSDPQVIYVPQYNPTVVVVSSPTPVVAYYPTAYPVYYYPYPSGHRFATGFFFGTATAFAVSWGAHAIRHGVHDHYHDHHGWGGRGDVDIDINRGDVNIDRSTNIKNERNTEINRGGGGGRERPGDGGSTWKPDKRPGQKPGSSIGTRPSTRPGDPGYRPSTGRRPSAGTQPAGGGTRPTTRPSTTPTRDRSASSGRGGRSGSSGSYSTGSMSGAKSSRNASAASSRGKSSRGGGGGSHGGSRGGGGRGGGGGGRRR